MNCWQNILVKLLGGYHFLDPTSQTSMGIFLDYSLGTRECIFSYQWWWTHYHTFFSILAFQQNCKCLNTGKARFCIKRISGSYLFGNYLFPQYFLYVTILSVKQCWQILKNWLFDWSTNYFFKMSFFVSLKNKINHMFGRCNPPWTLCTSELFDQCCHCIGIGC